MSSPAPADHDPFNTRRPEVFRLKGAQWILFYPAAWLLRLYFRTWRIHISPDDRALLDNTPPPRILATWHNRSLAVPVLRRILDPGKVACLVSPSKVAAWEAAFFEAIGYRVIRGSTTRRSIQSGIELLRALREGYDAGITPDGPSGPLYSISDGVAAIARKSGTPFIFIGLNCRAALRLRTWDRHLGPLPFARVEIRMAAVPAAHPWRSGGDESTACNLRRVCLEVTEDPFTVVADEHE